MVAKAESDTECEVCKVNLKCSLCMKVKCIQAFQNLRYD